MTKRQLTILILVLIIIVAAIFGFLYLQRTSKPPQNPGTGTNFVSEFNPFAQNPQPPPGGGDTENTDPATNVETEQNEVRLLRVSSMSVAGYTVYPKERYKEIQVLVPTEDSAPPTPETPAKPSASTKTTKPTPPPTEIVPALRYVARGTGNIFETFADKIEERQFSTTVIPKIYEALFGSKGESVVMRYLKPDDSTIATFTGVLPKELLGGDTTNNNEVKGTFLPDKISDLSASPDGTKVFYLLNAGDGVVGVTASTSGAGKVQVFDSPFTEWLSQWPSAKMITLTTKPSYASLGYTYAINTDKKDFNRILGNIYGLTTLTSPSGKLILYADSGLSLNIYNTGTGETIPLTARTMPEKCVWDKGSTVLYCAVPKSTGNALYPDSWYQGEVSFSDEIWRLDASSGTGAQILDPDSIQEIEAIDGIKLSLDDEGKYLFFVNKKNSILWELILN